VPSRSPSLETWWKPKLLTYDNRLKMNCFKITFYKLGTFWIHVINC